MESVAEVPEEASGLRHTHIHTHTHTDRPFNSWSWFAVDDHLELGVVAEWNGGRVGFLEELRMSLSCHVAQTWTQFTRGRHPTTYTHRLIERLIVKLVAWCCNG